MLQMFDLKQKLPSQKHFVDAEISKAVYRSEMNVRCIIYQIM